MSRSEMERITFSKFTQLIVLILLISLKNEIKSLELNCNLTSSRTYLNEPEIEIKPIIGVNKCANDYRDQEMIKKCEYFISNKPKISPINSFLFRPVTNRFKNTTYWNEFCAICNYESGLEYWSTWTHLDNLNSLCIFDKFDVLKGSAATDIHQITQKFFENGLKLTSKLENSTELRCSVDENWPLNLLQFIVPCLVDQFRKSHKERLYSCSYLRNDGRYCSDMNIIIEGLDFVRDKNKKIVSLDRSVLKKRIRGEYTVESGLVDVVYFCEESDDMLHRIIDWVAIALNILSIIFLSVYLFLNFSKRYLKSFPNKIIYSYAIGLLVTHLLSTFVALILPLLGEGYFFSNLFIFFWTMIISFEFSRSTYSTFKKRKVNVSSQSKRYFIYCIVGFVIPTILPIIYFLILRTGRQQCPVISDHFGVPWRPIMNSSASYFVRTLEYIFNASFFVVLPILFVLQASVLIYVTKCGPIRVRSTAKRNNSIVLLKMGCIMGAHWMVNGLCVLYDSVFEEYSVIVDSAAWVSELCINMQGVLVFFVFCFKKNWINDFLVKFKCKEKRTRQSISAGIGTTVQFSGFSPQLTDSTETKE